MAELEIWREPFAAVWPEVQDLGVRHFDEVDGDVEPKRKFALDAVALHELSKQGIFIFLTARVDGLISGYFTWNVIPDMESVGLLVAHQGAWFVDSGAPRKTARALWDRSIEELRFMGVQCIFPHHRLQGRGTGIGRFFERRGAKPIQLTYSLWIGD